MDSSDTTAIYTTLGWGVNETYIIKQAVVHNCGCYITAHDEDEIKSMGLKVSKGNRFLRLAKKNIPPEWQYNPGKYPLDFAIPNEVKSIKVVPPINLTPDKKNIYELPFKNINVNDILPAATEFTIDEKKKYITLFLKEFSTTLGKPIVYIDKTNTPLVISERLFLADKTRTEDFKIFKGGREKYLLLIADAIKNPLEIWLYWGKDIMGRERLTRRYIKLFKLLESDLSAFAVFEHVLNIVKEKFESKSQQGLGISYSRGNILNPSFKSNQYGKCHKVAKAQRITKKFFNLVFLCVLVPWWQKNVIKNLKNNYN